MKKRNWFEKIQDDVFKPVFEKLLHFRKSKLRVFYLYSINWFTYILLNILNYVYRAVRKILFKDFPMKMYIIINLLFTVCFIKHIFFKINKFNKI